MMSRLVACYELLEEDSRVLVELPVVGLSDVLDGTPRRITVLNPETGEIHPFGEEIRSGRGASEPWSGLPGPADPRLHTSSLDRRRIRAPGCSRRATQPAHVGAGRGSRSAA